MDNSTIDVKDRINKRKYKKLYSALKRMNMSSSIDVDRAANRTLTGTKLLMEKRGMGDKEVDVEEKLKKITLEKLKEAVDQLEEEFGMMFFGKLVELVGRNTKTNKRVRTEGTVSEVNVFITDDLDIDVKIKFKEAAKAYDQIEKVTVIDTLPTAQTKSGAITTW